MSRAQENYWLSALDERIRNVVEQVLSRILMEGTKTARREVVLGRVSGDGINLKGSVVQTRRPRGRPPGRKIEIEGKIVKKTPTREGSLIYTNKEKYLQRRNGSLIKVSHVKGSLEPARAMGYSSAQYQLARRYHWPMPCPMEFVPPPRRPRGRRPKNA